jgi:homoserine kinase
MADAIFNVQRTALLVSAVVSRDEHAMKEALQDRLHEPYRNAMVPELDSLRQMLSDKNIIGCVLCGGGPAVLIIVNRKNKSLVQAAVNVWAAEQVGTQVLDLEVDRHGIREIAD